MSDFLFDITPLVTPTYPEHLTIQERYESWRDANPWIIPTLARLLDDWSAHGGRRVGVKAATEWLRFFYARSIESSDFRCNNSYTSRLARDLIAQYPHLADVIETREAEGCLMAPHSSEQVTHLNELENAVNTQVTDAQIDLDALAKLAENAINHQTWGFDRYPSTRCPLNSETPLAEAKTVAEWELIRALSPATILALIGRLAEAWDEGRLAERRDWQFAYDLTTPDEDRQPLQNPYRDE